MEKTTKNAHTHAKKKMHPTHKHTQDGARGNIWNWKNSNHSGHACTHYSHSPTNSDQVPNDRRGVSIHSHSPINSDQVPNDRWGVSMHAHSPINSDQVPNDRWRVSMHWHSSTNSDQVPNDRRRVSMHSHSPINSDQVPNDRWRVGQVGKQWILSVVGLKAIKKGCTGRKSGLSLSL